MRKLVSKKLDVIAINDVSNGKVFGENYNSLHLITKDQKEYILERNNKDRIAKQLLEYIFI